MARCYSESSSIGTGAQAMGGMCLLRLHSCWWYFRGPLPLAMIQMTSFESLPVSKRCIQRQIQFPDRKPSCTWKHARNLIRVDFFRVMVKDGTFWVLGFIFDLILHDVSQADASCSDST